MHELSKQFQGSVFTGIHLQVSPKLYVAREDTVGACAAGIGDKIIPGMSTQVETEPKPHRNKWRPPPNPLAVRPHTFTLPVCMQESLLFVKFSVKTAISLLMKEPGPAGK